VSQVRLHVVTGKGGVGKSTVSAALALAAARSGARTLAIEIPERAGLCRILGASPEGPGKVTRARDHLDVAYFDGAAALSEYLTRRVRLRGVVDVVLDHPLYRAFVHAAPGVQELMAMGKVRDELRRRRRGSPYWDVVVVDAGATGHALQLLGMPAAAADAFGGGLVHREAERIDALLRDPVTTAVHVVATAEEMPLAEAVGALDVLRNRLHMPVRSLLVNQCRPVAPPDSDEGIHRLARLDVDPRLHRARDALHTAVERARGWERIQERGIAGTEARTGLRVTRLPRLAPAEPRDHAEALGALVAEGRL
jgi:anion-transporting  ArsA/GET3 family ATPase